MESEKSHLLVSVLRALWQHSQSVSAAAFGLFLIVLPIVFHPPTQGDLTEVKGVLSSYTIEANQSWFAQHISRYGPGTFVLLKIEHRPGRFWSDAVTPYNVTRIFPRMGAQLRVYYEPNTRFDAINGDGHKSYGLTVDGTEIQSLDAALSHDEWFAYFWLPVGSVCFLLLAAYCWRREETRRRNAAGNA